MTDIPQAEIDRLAQELDLAPSAVLKALERLEASGLIKRTAPEPLNFQQIGTNCGHGHAWKRPDGVRMRCGGPRICPVCAKDAALVSAAVEWVKGGDVDPGPAPTVEAEVSIQEMQRAGFTVGLVSTHGHPAGTWGFTSAFRETSKGFRSEALAWAAARPQYVRERANASAFLGDHDRRVTELLEANNRYQQEARDARAEAARLESVLEQIAAHQPSKGHHNSNDLIAHESVRVSTEALGRTYSPENFDD